MPGMPQQAMIAAPLTHQEVLDHRGMLPAMIPESSSFEIPVSRESQEDMPCPRQHRCCRFEWSGRTKWPRRGQSASCPALTAQVRMRAHPAEAFRRHGCASLQGRLSHSATRAHFCARRPKAPKVAENHAWHEAEHAIVQQREDPTWISSFPRVAKRMPNSSKQDEKRSMSLGPSRETLRLFLDRKPAALPEETGRLLRASSPGPTPNDLVFPDGTENVCRARLPRRIREARRACQLKDPRTIRSPAQTLFGPKSM